MLRYILPPAVLVAAFFVGKHLIDNAPEPARQPTIDRSPIVDVKLLSAENYTVELRAAGVVRPRTQTNIVAEVAGRVTNIANGFEDGGFVNKDQLLFQIDTSNYENAIAIAQSDASANQYTLQQIDTEEQTVQRSLQLAQNNLNLGQQELNRVRELWNQRLIARNVLDNEEQRVNQLRQQVEEIQGRLAAFPSRRSVVFANMASANARLEREQLNLNRTQVLAPYAGRVLERRVDLGQYVSPGTLLGIIYAVDYVEVDLPMSLAQFGLLGLPANLSNGRATGPLVEFNSNVSTSERWQGRVVRTSAALNTDSRQINVIARIDRPFESSRSGAPALQIGQFLNARIQGKTFNSVYVLPPAAVRQGREILLMQDNQVYPQAVDLVWSNEQVMVVSAPNDIEGEQVIITPLAQAVTGMQVKTLEQQRAEAAARRQSGVGGGRTGGDRPNGTGSVTSTVISPASADAADPAGKAESSSAEQQPAQDPPPAASGG